MNSKLLLVPLVLAALAVAPALAPATRPASRPTDPQMAEFSARLAAFDKLLPHAAALRDPAERERLAPALLPLAGRLIQLNRDLLARNPINAANCTLIEIRILADVIAMGGSVDNLGGSPENVDAARDAAEFITADRDRQVGIVTKHIDVIAADPFNMVSFLTLVIIRNEGEAATPELTAKIQETLKATLATKLARSREARERAHPAPNAPMVLEGTLRTGAAFSTAELKGKVILVDFWATWCVPCKAGLPHVKEIYKKYHDQGLEIVGVSNDYKVENLNKFVDADPDMPWPQLFDAAAAAQNKWHPLCTKYAIQGIPTMYLIDRNGICRSLTARDNMDTLIPALLAETASAPK
jgi:thiol-disulfide isomerase/thioredoxin